MSGSSFASMGAVGGETGRSIAVLPTGPSSPASTRGNELREQPADLLVDLVADGTNLLDGLSGGVFELPIQIPLPRVHRARVAAPHGDDDVDVLGQAVRQQLRHPSSEVDADLAHRLDDRRIEPL